MTDKVMESGGSLVETSVHEDKKEDKESVAVESETEEEEGEETGGGGEREAPTPGDGVAGVTEAERADDGCKEEED